MVTVKKIDLILVYPIRHLVLRKGKPIESCYFIDDEKETTNHFGVFLDDKIIGVISLFEQKNQLFTDEIQFQIRGMSVLEEHQHKGFGKLLIQKAETYCFDVKSDIIWFNARESAITFYQKLNYKINGKPFDIENIGLHYIMFKQLN